MLQRTNIQEKLSKTRKKQSTENQIMAEVYAILNKDAVADQQNLHKSDKTNFSTYNNFNFDLLKNENIYHIDQIKKVCIDYRLRFLDSDLFKGKTPEEAFLKIKKMEKEHQTSLTDFKIIAPSKLFKLENADDPLLFAPLGNDYYYLIHKWGNDLHPLRKWLMKPFKTLENFVVFLLFLSLLFAVFIPVKLFSTEENSVQFVLLFLFTFKCVAGVAIFYGFALGKNFSENIWNSKYFNA